MYSLDALSGIKFVHINDNITMCFSPRFLKKKKKNLEKSYIYNVSHGDFLLAFMHFTTHSLCFIFYLFTLVMGGGARVLFILKNLHCGFVEARLLHLSSQLSFSI